MLTESEIKKEIYNAEYLYKLRRDSKHYHEGYYIQGYITALKVVLGEKQSEIIKQIKEKTDFETLKGIIENNE
mgnify:CR=1 FL=1